MSLQYDTILFDMDGTLFDTEQIYHEVWNKVGVPDEVYRQFIGRDKPTVMKIIRDNTSLDPEQAQARKDTLTWEILREKGVPLKPGLLPTLQWLKSQGYHSCIATSSPKETAVEYLQLTHTTEYFDQIVSGNTLPHGKPAPDIYLLAARAMSAAPTQCVVVEDSYNGVRSGHAAGMKTVMIPDEVAPDAEMQHTADIILTSLAELPGYLEKLNKCVKGAGTVSHFAKF